VERLAQIRATGTRTAIHKVVRCRCEALRPNMGSWTPRNKPMGSGAQVIVQATDAGPAHGASPGSRSV